MTRAQAILQVPTGSVARALAFAAASVSGGLIALGSGVASRGSHLAGLALMCAAFIPFAFAMVWGVKAVVGRPVGLVISRRLLRAAQRGPQAVEEVAKAAHLDITSRTPTGEERVASWMYLAAGTIPFLVAAIFARSVLADRRMAVLVGVMLFVGIFGSGLHRLAIHVRAAGSRHNSSSYLGTARIRRTAC